MSRWNPDESDEGRLPEGMERIGYDADTQTYSYRDSDGSYWEGDPGARYGVLHRSGTDYTPVTNMDIEHIRRSNSEAWRYMLPFFLLILVSFLLLLRLLGYNFSFGFGSGSRAGLTCPENSVGYVVKSGDSCWDIANRLGVAVADVVRLNEGLDCAKLKAGVEICVPA